MRAATPYHAATAGFALVEVVLVTVLLATVLTAVGVSLQSMHRAATDMERHLLIGRVADDFMNRLVRIDFGEPGGLEATPGQLTELFDDDDVFGTATLSALRRAPDDDPFWFQLLDFPYGGTWAVRVSADLNQDRDEDDPWEGRDDLLRIDIYYDGTLTLSTVRTVPVS